MPLVISSQELLCHAQAYSAVGFFRFLGRESIDRETWSLKQRAIHRVNLSLQDPNFAVNDANIGAVLCMVWGATFEVSIHFKDHWIVLICTVDRI